MLKREREGEAANPGPLQISLGELVPRGPLRRSPLDDPEAFDDFDMEWQTEHDSMQQVMQQEASPAANEVAIAADWLNPPRLAPNLPAGHPLFRPAYSHPEGRRQ